jgi:hypothetical protein
VIPKSPVFSDEEYQRCINSDDYRPIMFEWYKHAGELCLTFANLKRSSPAIRESIEPKHYGILIGLLHRCFKLVLSNTALTAEGDFGESTSILDRCIFESSIKLIWLCESDIENRFERFIVTGLKTEIEKREQTLKKVSERGGAILVIEKRMLDSVDDCLREAGFDETSIKNIPELPDLAAMIDSVGYPRMHYTAGQRVSSHFIHGTWVGLRHHYLDLSESGEYTLKSYIPQHVNQYMYQIDVMFEAIKSFVSFVTNHGEPEALQILKIIEQKEQAFGQICSDVIRADRQKVSPE